MDEELTGHNFLCIFGQLVCSRAKIDVNTTGVNIIFLSRCRYGQICKYSQCPPCTDKENIVYHRFHLDSNPVYMRWRSRNVNVSVVRRVSRVDRWKTKWNRNRSKPRCTSMFDRLFHSIQSKCKQHRHAMVSSCNKTVR